MALDEDSSKLRSDSALETPDQDKLGFAEFSENMAKTVRDRSPEQNFVVGIYGPWGSGKSSILNFMEYYFQNQDEPPVVVRFNPWWFSGQADLMRKFFDQLQSALGEDEFDEIRNKLSSFASSLSNLPMNSATGGMPVEQTLGFVADVVAVEDENLDRLKSDISDSLREVDQQVIILVDDIDRLTEGEIRQMFRLIKSVADFPNVVYVLAFDQRVVINALEGEQGISKGEEYLDKIIQLPKHIPVPEQGAIENLFIGGLNEILSESESEPEVDEQHWNRLYQYGILPTLRTPRDVVRLHNAVGTTFSYLGSNVNFIDLVAVETLRVFHREVYEEVRKNPNRFVNSTRLKDSEEDYESFLSETLADTTDKDRQLARELLCYLFPRVRTDVRDGRHYRENKDTYQKRRRICHPDMFNFYFRETVPKGELSAEKMDTILGKTDDEDMFAEELIDLSKSEGRDGRTQAYTFLQHFPEYIDEIPEENAHKIILAIFNVADQLCSADPRKGMLDQGSRMQLLSIVRDLLDEIDEAERCSVLKRAISAGDSPYFTSNLIGVLLQEHGERGADGISEEQRLLGREEIDGLKTVAVEKFSELAKESKLLHAPNAGIILNRWVEWSDSDTPQEWAKEKVESDEDLIHFVSQFIQQGRYASAADSGTTDYIDPRWIEPLVDYSSVESRFSELDRNELDEEDLHTVEVFEKGIQLLNDGKEPDDFSNWRDY